MSDSHGIPGQFVAFVDVAPAAPTDLAGTSDGSSVTLTWTDNSSEETGFEVQRADKPKGKKQPVWSTIAELGENATSYVDSSPSSSEVLESAEHCLARARQSWSISSAHAWLLTELAELRDEARKASRHRLAEQSMPRRAGDYYVRALTGYYEQDRSRCKHQLALALQRDVSHPFSLDLLATVLSEEKQYAEAAAVLSGGLYHWPDSRRLLELRATAMHRLNAYKIALQDAHRIVELEPKAAEGYRLRTLCYIQLNALAAAKDNCRTWMHHAPEDAEAHELFETLEARLHRPANSKAASDLDP